MVKDTKDGSAEDHNKTTSFTAAANDTVNSVNNKPIRQLRSKGSGRSGLTKSLDVSELPQRHSLESPSDRYSSRFPNQGDNRFPIESSKDHTGTTKHHRVAAVTTVKSSNSKGNLHAASSSAPNVTAASSSSFSHLQSSLSQSTLELQWYKERVRVLEAQARAHAKEMIEYHKEEARWEENWTTEIIAMRLRNNELEGQYSESKNDRCKLRIQLSNSSANLASALAGKQAAEQVARTARDKADRDALDAVLSQRRLIGALEAHLRSTQDTAQSAQEEVQAITIENTTIRRELHELRVSQPSQSLVVIEAASKEGLGKGLVRHSPETSIVVDIDSSDSSDSSDRYKASGGLAALRAQADEDVQQYVAALGQGSSDIARDDDRRADYRNTGVGVHSGIHSGDQLGSTSREWGVTEEDREHRAREGQWAEHEVEVARVERITSLKDSESRRKALGEGSYPFSAPAVSFGGGASSSAPSVCVVDNRGEDLPPAVPREKEPIKMSVSSNGGSSNSSSSYSSSVDESEEEQKGTEIGHWEAQAQTGESNAPTTQPVKSRTQEETQLVIQSCNNNNHNNNHNNNNHNNNDNNNSSSSSSNSSSSSSSSSSNSSSSSSSSGDSYSSQLLSAHQSLRQHSGSHHPRSGLAVWSRGTEYSPIQPIQHIQPMSMSMSMPMTHASNPSHLPSHLALSTRPRSTVTGRRFQAPSAGNLMSSRHYSYGNTYSSNSSSQPQYSDGGKGSNGPSQPDLSTLLAAAAGGARSTNSSSSSSSSMGGARSNNSHFRVVPPNSVYNTIARDPQYQQLEQWLNTSA